MPLANLKLRNSLGKASTAEEVWSIIWSAEGSQDEILRAVAGGSPVFDDSLVRSLLLGLESDSLPLLVENPAAREHWETIALWLARRIPEEHRRHVSAAKCLKMILDSGALPPEHPAFQILLGYAMEGKGEERRREHYRAVEVILSAPHLSPSLLEELSRSGFSYLTLYQIGKHCSASSELRFRLLKSVLDGPMERSGGESVESLLARDHIASDPRMKPVLLAHGLKWAWYRSVGPFVEEASAKDWLDVFRLYLDSPTRALDIWDKRRERVEPLLEREDLARMLASEDVRLREMGVRLASGVIERVSPCF